MKGNNKGFSLVELIVVIGIIAVLAAVVGLGMGMVSQKPVEECAKKMTTVLKRSQRMAAGKSYNQVTIKRGDDGQIVVVQNFAGAGAPLSEQEVIVVGRDFLTVTYTLDGGNSFQSIEEAPLYFSYDRASTSMGYANGTTSYCTEIRVSRGSGSPKSIELIPLTGKISEK